MSDHPLILVVEDDPSVVELERVLLEDEGYEVLTAKDGLEGLLKTEFRRPALILLDLMLPVVDGARMFEELRADARVAATPVVIVTGMADAHNVFDDLVGRENVIIKPFGLDELLARVVALAGPGRKDER
ncbi:MAG TPA: response regulator [Actinomycetota bacterium]|nr:response regulator [Actinomycetota bacterium]